MQQIDKHISFKTISAPSQGIYKDRGSKFLAFAFPVLNEHDIINQITQLKQEFNDARHFCYAYILGYDKAEYRVNDDGEPSGSAGLPIYNQCLSNDLTNILVVVIRYFGGTKLGIPGLIKAYKEATRNAFEHAKFITIEPIIEMQFTFAYEQTNSVMSLMKKFKCTIIDKQFGNSCYIRFSLSVNVVPLFEKTLKNMQISYKII